MVKITYLDFDLLIEGSEAGYRARVLNSPAGDASGVCPIDPTTADLQASLRRLEAGDTDEAFLVDLGCQLFNGLFAGEIGAIFRASLGQARGRGKGLRIRLRLEPPELAALPWEYLYDPQEDRFLAISPETPLVRYVPMRGSVRPTTVSPPLRVLVVISSPSNVALLEVEQEKEIIEAALAEWVGQGLVQLQFVERATVSEISQAMRRFRPHVFHFIGHGQYRNNRAHVMLENDDGHARPVGERDFREFFLGIPEARLVVLNACQTATTSSVRPLAGLSPRILQRNLSAVVAMQHPIQENTALIFSREFYRCMALGYPLDAAMAEARRGIFLEMGSGVRDWGIPVLFLRAQDARLFEVTKAEEAKVEGETPVQPPAQVTLLLDGISSFGPLERQYLMGVLTEALHLEREQIRVLRVESGSVRVTLELPADAAGKLARMIESGQLDLTPVFGQMAVSKYHITVTDSQGIRIGDHAQVVPHFDSPTAPQWSHVDLLRLQHLTDNIRQDLALLKDYEDTLRYEDDPRRRARYRREIKQLQSSAASYQQEYGALQTKVEGEPPQQLQDVGAQLQTMNTRLDTLLADLLAIRDDLGDLRAVVLGRFDASEQAIISAIVERLDQSQLATTQAVLDGIEAGRVPETELQETLAAVRRALAEIRQRGVVLTDLALVSGAKHMSEVVNAPKLDVKHKLKITAPIIPLILAYEGEIALGSGLDLEAAWKRLVARVLGGKPTR